VQRANVIIANQPTVDLKKCGLPARERLPMPGYFGFAITAKER